MELQEKVVLVTEPNGFVATYVARRLREQGLRVRVRVRRPEARDELVRSGVEALLGEVTDARKRPGGCWASPPETPSLLPTHRLPSRSTSSEGHPTCCP